MLPDDFDGRTESRSMDMDIHKNSKYELTNLIAKSRAKWLLSKKDEYFLE